MRKKIVGKKKWSGKYHFGPFWVGHCFPELSFKHVNLFAPRVQVLSCWGYLKLKQAHYSWNTEHNSFHGLTWHLTPCPYHLCWSQSLGSTGCITRAWAAICLLGWLFAQPLLPARGEDPCSGTWPWLEGQAASSNIQDHPFPCWQLYNIAVATTMPACMRNISKALGLF